MLSNGKVIELNEIPIDNEGSQHLNFNIERVGHYAKMQELRWEEASTPH